MIAPATDLLLAPLGENVAGELLVYARSVDLLGLLEGGLLLTDTRVRLGRSLRSAGAAGGLTVPHGEPGQEDADGDRGH